MGINKVIIQFKAGADVDLDRLYAIEETLIQAFSQASDGVVDGHDINHDTFNIFIHPRGPWGPSLERVKAFLKLRGALGDAVVAKFHGKSERYEVVHPANHPGEFAI